MLYTGQFRNVNNELITVEILTNNDSSTTRTISRENGLWFSSEPVVIEMDVEDTFEHIIRKSCTINLVTRDYQGTELFADNARSVRVEIFNGVDCLFFGFLEPNTYSQPFAKPLEEFSLNCVDALSTLQYYKYNNATPTNFTTKKQQANVVTFKNILMSKIFNNEILNSDMYYDLSRGQSQERLNQIFDDLAISETYLFGEDYDDCMTNEEVLEEMLKYLNLHIIQHGYAYYIFDWNSIKDQNTQWLNLTNDTTVTLPSQVVTFTGAMHGADDTSITVAEVYNQIAVKDKLEEQDTIIESPLDKNNLTSLYTGKQLYMTEFISEGSGDHAHDAMVRMITGNTTNYEKASQVDWFIQAMQNNNWKFYYNGNTLVDTLAEQNGSKYVNQWKIAKYLKEHPLVPYIFKFGSIERQVKVVDNSPVAKINMKPYLYISINGNETDEENYQLPNDTTLHAAQPMIEYVGSNSGGVFSPVDDDTINYLVFSGKIILQPIVYESTRTVVSRTQNDYEGIRLNGMAKSEGEHAKLPTYDYSPDGYVDSIHRNNLVKSENNGEGRYYVRKFYTTENPSDTPTSYQTDGSSGLQPWTEDKSSHGYEYNYSQIGDDVDRFSKIPILECELIIGNKRLIETNIDEFGNSTFEWVTLGQEPTETYDGQTYTITTFSLGVNPKIEDYIIGQEYDIQNTIDYTMNLDTEGTAIPIKKSDAVSGAVIFRILGPIQSIWQQINKSTHRHWIFWKHTHWNAENRFILSHVENIIIQDFECKVFSNNAGYETPNSDNDLIYMSDETDRFVNKKDDINFEFITQLSAEECIEKGISTSVNLNAVINARTNQPLDTIYNATTAEVAKAEEHYVDNYYNEYSSPKILLTATMHNSNNIDWRNKYHSNVLNKNFFVQSENFNVRENKKEITFKEI